MSIKNFKNYPGSGVEAQVDGKKVKIGSLKWLTESFENLSIYKNFSDDMEMSGESAVGIIIDSAPAGIISFESQIRDNAEKTIKEIKEMGIALIMMTGDDKKSADSTAAAVGISSIYYRALPIDKANKVKELQSEGKIVAVAGDGINDAPAITLADIGIAMGTGTDIAAEAGDIVIIRGGLENISRAIKLSRKTVTTIRQNLFWAFIYNIILIPMAAFGYLDPMIAAGAMAFSSVSVVANSLRLRSA